MTILVVDDQINNRANIADWVANTFGEGQAIPQDEPLHSVEALLERVRRDDIDTVVLDYKMARNYAPANGLVLATQLYDAHVPSVIVSSYVADGLPDYFWLGSKVPAILARGNLHFGLGEAIHKARLRMEGHYARETRPSRTLVRIEELVEDKVGLVVPAYRADAKLVDRAQLEQRLPGVALSVGLRMMAQVNLGAPSLDQLYVADLEVAPALDEAHARLLRR